MCIITFQYNIFVWVIAWRRTDDKPAIIWTNILCQGRGRRATWGLGYYEISMIKSMLANKDFQTWHLIGWQYKRQPIRRHVKKSLLTNMDFNMDFT